MAYDHYFPKFGSQSRAKIFKPVYYNAKWKNPNLYFRAAKHFGPSIGGFGFAAFAFLVFTTEWRVICDYIPYYNTKFTTPPPK